MGRKICILLAMIFVAIPSYADGWIWGKGSIGNNVTAWPVATDRAGNVYAAGVANGLVSFDGYSLPFKDDSNVCVLVKYDMFGQFIWARTTHYSPHAFLVGITTDGDGNCYMLGWMPDTSISFGAVTLYNNAYPNAQYFIAKYSPAGDVIWATSAGGRTGTYTAPPVAFDSKHEAKILGLGGIIADSTGHIYITTAFNLPTVKVGGSILVNEDASGITNDILVAKYDTAGNAIWATSTGGENDDIPCSITVTQAGDVYVAGMYNSDAISVGSSVITNTATSAQRWNGFVARYNAAGNGIWATGSGGNNTYTSGITCDTSGNIYFTGGTNDGTISFGATAHTSPYPGTPVLYIMGMNAAGVVLMAKFIGSPTGGATYGYGIALAPSGYIWVNGAYSDSINIDGKTLRIPSNSVNPIFIAGYDRYGLCVASDSLQSGTDDQAGIACDDNGNVLLCADYNYPCAPFIIANDVLADAATNESWMYVAKYSGPGSNGGGNGTITLYEHTYATMCRYDSLVLNAPSGYNVFVWNNGSRDSTLKVPGEGTYWVTAYNNEGTAMNDTISVSYHDGLCNCNAYIPDAFSPNGDGVNDTYGPLFANGCNIAKYYFAIYNRWGQRVFYSNDPAARWDGIFNGIKQDLDTYKYYLSYFTGNNFPEHMREGDVMLIR